MLHDRIRLVITDLDNTLYDWVTFFARSFDAMTKRAAEILEVSEEVLLDDVKRVHQRRRNSEHPFALLETDIVARRFPSATRLERKEALDGAFHAFNRARKESLRLYPGVVAALEAIRASGAVVVGHTDASVANALFRLGKLGLLRWIDRVYAVEDSGDGHPSGRDPAAAEHRARVRALGHHQRKPDARVVRGICEDYGVAPGDALYVGDSLVSDMAMAKGAGVWAAWAKYGTVYERERWETLARVTHWTEADVARAERARESAGAGEGVADVILESGFEDVLDQFGFGESDRVSDRTSLTHSGRVADQAPAS